MFKKCSIAIRTLRFAQGRLLQQLVNRIVAVQVSDTTKLDRISKVGYIIISTTHKKFANRKNLLNLGFPFRGTEGFTSTPQDYREYFLRRPGFYNQD
jgi:hypothetical protein